MHALVLTRNRYLYATRRIISTLNQRGHTVTVADPLACSALVGGSGTVLVVTPDGELNGAHVVIGRSSPMTREAVLRIMRHLEPSAKLLVNPPNALAIACDKFATLSLLARAGIPVPPSRLLFSDGGLEDAVNAFGGGPVVIKTLDGGRGRGVCLAESSSSARSVAQALIDEGASVMIQKFYAECRGRDLRAFVIGDELVACSARQGKSGDFRANAHCGGTMTAYAASPEIRRIAVESARAVGLVIAGVDILETNDGPVVLEVNGTPGLRGIEESTDTDIAGIMVQHFEQQCQ